MTTTSTTTLPPDVIPITSEVVAVPKEPEFYFSVDDREFDPRDLLESVILITEYSDGTVIETDIIDQVNYNGQTPEILFEDRYDSSDYYGVYRGYVSPWYNGEMLDVESLIYIGVKGDADLNGIVEISDATNVLTYYAMYGASLEPRLIDNENEHYEYLAFFLADVNTESKAGANSEAGLLEIDDATNILTYYAMYGASLDPQWDEIIPSLQELVGSLWYERAQAKLEEQPAE